MYVQGPHDGSGTLDKVFVSMEYGDTSNALSRGQWVSLDFVDDSGTILGDRRGTRVVLMPAGTSTYPRHDVVGCAEESAPVRVAGKEGKMILVQVYGFHDFCRYNPRGEALDTATLKAHRTEAGAMEGVVGTALPLGNEPELAAGRNGVPLSAAGVTGNYPAIVRSM